MTAAAPPRMVFQAGVCGVTAAIGYAIGAFLGWLAATLIPWRPGGTMTSQTAGRSRGPQLPDD